MKNLLRSTVITITCCGLLSSCKTMSRKTVRAKHKAPSKATQQLQVAENEPPVAAEKSDNIAQITPANLAESAPTPLLSETKTSAPVTQPEQAAINLPNADPSPAQSADLAPVARGPVNFIKVCDALKAKNFERYAVSHQVRWLCDLGGFAALQATASSGHESGNIREYFDEYNQTMYYGAGLSSTGSLAKASAIGKDFCGSYKGVRALMAANDSKGFTANTNPGEAAVRGFGAAPENSTTNDGQCEYFQAATPSWGHRFDLLASKKYGKLAGQESGRNVYWQVDAMVAPLNYSSLRQYSSLVLFWETEGQIKGVVLTRTRYTVEGSILGVTRANLKANVAAIVAGYVDAVK